MSFFSLLLHLDWVATASTEHYRFFIQRLCSTKTLTNNSNFDRVYLEMAFDWIYWTLSRLHTYRLFLRHLASVQTRQTWCDRWHIVRCSLCRPLEFWPSAAACASCLARISRPHWKYRVHSSGINNSSAFHIVAQVSNSAEKCHKKLTARALPMTQLAQPAPDVMGSIIISLLRGGSA